MSSRAPGAPERQHYSRAPIVEAIIDVRFATEPALSLDALRAMAIAEVGFTAIDNAYIVEAEANFPGSDAAPTAAARQQHAGFRLRDERGQRAAHFDSSRFAFSKYAPYDRWETFRDGARQVWDHFASAARLTTIKRASVRYVNRLDLPLPPGDLREWLLAVPFLNPGLGAGVSSYMMELHLPQVDLPKTVAIMRQALAAQQRANSVSIVLDIEVIREMSLAGRDTEELWQILETLHDRENQIFERTITERVRDRIR